MFETVDISKSKERWQWFNDVFECNEKIYNLTIKI